MNIDNYIKYVNNNIKYASDKIKHYYYLYFFIKKFTKLFSFNFNIDEDCPICLENKCEVYLPCNHCFHLRCILTWFKTSKSINCPFCRNQYNYLLFKD